MAAMSNMYSLHEPDPDAPSGEGGVPVRVVAGADADVTEFSAALATAQEALARAMVAAGRLAGSGVCERVEGMDLERFAGLAHGLTGRDARGVVAAGEVLRDAPVLAGLVAEGTLSASQVLAMRGSLQGLSRAQRQTVDERIGAQITEADGVAAFDPDGLVEAVERAADDCREHRSRRERDRRAQRANRVQVQQGLDGRVRLFGDYDAVAGAAIVNALDAAAGPPHAAGDREDAGDGAGERRGGAAGDSADDADAGEAANAETPRWVRPTARGGSLADALLEIAADYLGGSACEHACRQRPARPLVVVHVDLDQVTGHPDGRVELDLRGGLPRVSAATVEALANDGDVRAVLLDGERPLAATGKVDAARVPVATGLAVRARDRGCRFPASRDPIGHADLHHLLEQARGGGHDPDNLVCLSRRWHTTVHERGWTLSLDPVTAQLTVERAGRRYHSLPRGAPLPAAPDPPSSTRDAPPRAPDPEPPPDDGGGATSRSDDPDDDVPF